MYGSAAAFKEVEATVNFVSVGSKKFRYTVTGKNTSSSDYQLGIDYLKFVKVN